MWTTPRLAATLLEPDRPVRVPGARRERAAAPRSQGLWQPSEGFPPHWGRPPRHGTNAAEQA
eukprot:8935728-Pyramimonas_sp.AAC.1